jgi:hypothetical protein
MNRMALVGSFVVTLCVAAGTSQGDAEEAKLVRSLQVELPGQEQNVMRQSWPAMGCWFWSERELQPNGYQRFIDLHGQHSAFRLLTASIRRPLEVTDPRVHDQVKQAAQYAEAHDMRLVMDLDVRVARKAFMERYPDELQEILRLREVAMSDSGEATLTVEPLRLGDHYTPSYPSVSGRVVCVYSYVADSQGIEPDSVQDITARVKIVEATPHVVKVAIPCTKEDHGRTACMMAAWKLLTPDVFAPHLLEFQRGLLKQYADVSLAGAWKDEWGFPGRFAPRTDDAWFSPFMAEAYRQRRPGHDLVRDLLLMCKGEKGRGSQRVAAINHWMEMNWQRNRQIEADFYRAVKEVFGREAVVGVHPTWYPSLCKEEVFKNGWDWWVVQRDLAQTDESTPFCARTALAKKWRSPLWYNMYYASSVESYQDDLWRHALAGGRMNYHPVYPRPKGKPPVSLLTGPLFRADCRISLLNYISTAPVDCPVAVVFGHPCALNWAGPAWADAGLAVTNGLWQDGFYADLIPTSEITNGSLTIAEDGTIVYGPQRYRAVVLCHPQYEREAVAQFFQKAASASKTALYRLGDWTEDFDGRPFSGNAALPRQMQVPADATACVRDVIARLREAGVEPQTPSTMHTAGSFPPSMMPNRSGQCRLLDGTLILAAGENDVMGDPIQKTVRLNGQEVRFDAVGVAAVRLEADGALAAMAAGGLRRFEGGGVALELPERTDLALWRDRNGHWQGVIQGDAPSISEPLAKLTKQWSLLRLPTPQPEADR